MYKMPRAMSPPTAPESAEPTTKVVSIYGLTADPSELTKQERYSKTELFSLVPVRKEQSHRWKQTALKQAQQQPESIQLSSVLDETHAHAADPPKECDRRYHTVELEALDEHRPGNQGLADEDDNAGDTLRFASIIRSALKRQRAIDTT